MLQTVCRRSLDCLVHWHGAAVSVTIDLHSNLLSIVLLYAASITCNPSSRDCMHSAVSAGKLSLPVHLSDKRIQLAMWCKTSLTGTHGSAATTLGALLQLSWISSMGRSRQTAALHVLRPWMLWQRNTSAQVSIQPHLSLGCDWFWPQHRLSVLTYDPWFHLADSMALPSTDKWQYCCYPAVAWFFASQTLDVFVWKHVGNVWCNLSTAFGS